MVLKKSQYTSVINIDNDYVLIYSAMKDTFLCCSANDWKSFISNPSSKSDIQDLMIQIGALISQDIDEIKMAKQNMDMIDFDRSVLHVHVNPTLQCNLNCWYCYESHEPFSKMQPNTIDAILKFINIQMKGDEVKTLQLSFFGGEPLLYFMDVAYPLIERASEICKDNGKTLSIHFTTNGTLLNDKIISILRPYRVSFQITLDGYADVHDKVRNIPGISTYSLILNNVFKLLSSEKHVVLRINFTHENVDCIQSIINDLSTWPIELFTYLHVDLQQVWQDIRYREGSGISEKIQYIMERISEYGIEVTSPWKATKITDSCYGDKINHVSINYNGDLFFCTARDFKRENRKGYISSQGELIWENDAHNYHMSLKFTNPICQKCRIGALCGGGCRQKVKETIGKTEGCPLGFNDSDIDDIILKRFERFVIIPYRREMVLKQKSMNF